MPRKRRGAKKGGVSIVLGACRWRATFLLLAKTRVGRPAAGRHADGILRAERPATRPTGFSAPGVQPHVSDVRRVTCAHYRRAGLDCSDWRQCRARQPIRATRPRSAALHRRACQPLTGLSMPPTRSPRCPPNRPSSTSLVCAPTSPPSAFRPVLCRVPSSASTLLPLHPSFHHAHHHPPPSSLPPSPSRLSLHLHLFFHVLVAALGQP